MHTSLSSIEKAIRIMYEFSIDAPEKGVLELSQATGIPKSTVHRILTTMQRGGILEQDEHSKKYRLGLKFLSFSNVVTANSRAHREATPIYSRLANELGRTVYVSALREGKVLCLHSFNGTDSKNDLTCFGNFNEVHCTSEGKVLLAFTGMNNEDIKFHRYTRYTITNREDFTKELQKIKKLGYAVTQQESQLGEYSLAVPLKDSQDNVTFTISIRTQENFIREGKLTSFVTKMKAASKEIEAVIKKWNFSLDNVY